MLQGLSFSANIQACHFKHVIEVNVKENKKHKVNPNEKDIF